MKICDALEEFWNSLEDYHNFEHKGILSNNISLEYEIKSDQPHLYFNCQKYGDLSFRTHDLELGNTPEEAYFWHSASQRGEKAKFEGFVNIFYPAIKGKLRGILSLEKDYNKLGIWIKSGRIIKKRTEKETNESGIGLLGIVTNHAQIMSSVGKIRLPKI